MSYLYGLDCLGEQRGDELALSGAEGWLYYLHDAEGYVRQGADMAGAIVSAWLFDPDGTVLEGPNGPVSHLICGGVYDWSTGLIYRGGRYFDPNLGIWLALMPLLVVQGWRKRKDRRQWVLLVCVGLFVVGSLAGCKSGDDTPACVDKRLLYLPFVAQNYSTFDSPSATATPPTSPIKTPIPPSGKTAYLTFDDGPDPFYTPEIALKLQSEGVQATFFLTGADPSDRDDPDSPDDFLRIYSEYYGQSIVSLMHSAGHAIGIHGWRHDHYWNLQSDGAVNEVRQTEKALKEILGVSELPDKLLRAPGGNWPSVPIPGYEGWYYYHWTVPGAIMGALDDYGTPPQTVVDNVIAELQAQGIPDDPIILLHSIRPGTHKAVVEPEYDLIGKLKSLGYDQFRRLPRPGDSTGTVIRQ